MCSSYNAREMNDRLSTLKELTMRLARLNRNGVTIKQLSRQFDLPEWKTSERVRFGRIFIHHAKHPNCTDECATYQNLKK